MAGSMESKRQEPNVELDAQMIVAYWGGMISAFRLRFGMSVRQVTERARWLAEQSADYRQKVSDRVDELRTRATINLSK